MKLSYNDIERIAEAELKSFTGGLTRSAWAVKPIPIEEFAVNHLGLRLVYTRLSNNGESLGITTYADTDIELNRYCRKEKIHVLKDTILLDECLQDSQDWQHTERGRKRFTIAHECAHHIIHRKEPEHRQTELQQKYCSRSFSVGEMKSLDDWSEWQANALAAALLMPKKYISLLLRGRRITYFGKRLNHPDKFIFDDMCYRFGVSKTALTLRLKQLDCIDFLSTLDYYDPSDIVSDKDYTRRAMGGNTFG
jgi:hypothetical protein